MKKFYDDILRDGKINSIAPRYNSKFPAYAVILMSPGSAMRLKLHRIRKPSMIKKKITSVIQFLKKDVWKTSVKEYSPFRLFSIQQLKIILLAAHTFGQKHSRSQAAAMTYYSILALVPSLTLFYGIMKGFGLEGTFRDQLYRNLSSHREFIDAVFNMAQSYVEKSCGTIFTGVGLTILIWGILRTLTTMEEAFNDIWGVKETKPLTRKLSDYLAVFTICPLSIILSGSITVFVSTQLPYVSENFSYLGPLISLIYTALFFFPFVMVWMVFTFIYIYMPNAQVNFISGLWGGLVAGTLYQITQWSYVIFQVWITRANAIYGSIAAVPLLLVWLQVSWMIVLFGAEIAFARQYLRTYEFEPEDIKPSPSLRKLVALLITYLCVKNFEQGQKPRTTQQIAEHLHLPGRLTQELISDLIETGLLCKIYLNDNKIFAYQPARTIDDITVEDVLNALEHLGQEDIPIRESRELKIITGHLKEFNAEIRRSKEHHLLKDL